MNPSVTAVAVLCLIGIGPALAQDYLPEPCVSGGRPPPEWFHCPTPYVEMAPVERDEVFERAWHCRETEHSLGLVRGGTGCGGWQGTFDGWTIPPSVPVHDTGSDTCQVEDWRWWEAPGGMLAIEGVATCTAGTMQLRLYEDAGETRRFLGATTGFIEGHVFEIIFMNIGNPTNLAIEYAITEGENW